MCSVLRLQPRALVNVFSRQRSHACHRRGFVSHATEWQETLRAAEQQSDDANRCYQVGEALVHGKDGAPRDTATGKVWLRRAAELGHSRAQLVLGQQVYDEMEALRAQAHAHDYQAAAEAEQWLSRAAMQGEVDAKRTLISVYVNRGDLPAAIGMLIGWMTSRTRGAL